MPDCRERLRPHCEHPKYPNRPGDAPTVLSILRRLCALPGHEFWQADISIRAQLPSDAAFTHAQVTDLSCLPSQSTMGVDW